MTQQEAIQALEEGKMITHEYFSNSEYIYMQNGRLYDENGVPLDWDFFWKVRKGEYWETGWDIYNDKS